MCMYFQIIDACHWCFTLNMSLSREVVTLDSENWFTLYISPRKIATFRVLMEVE